MRRSLFLILLLLNVFVVFSQGKEPAHLCFYRVDKMLCNSLNIDITLNRRYIHTLRPTIKKNVAMEYLMLSEGTIQVTISNWVNDTRAEKVINVVPGKYYYIKIDCEISGPMVTINGGNAQSEWVQASKDFLSTLAEDPAQPLIYKEDPNDRYQRPAEKTVKVDTVKQLVYVNQSNKYVFNPSSDVDTDIPVNSTSNDLTYALIIGNEDYSSFQPELKSEANVDFARNDASAFKEYLIRTLGVPEKNIIFVLDATYGQMTQAISKLSLIAKNTGGKARLIFYYAGHGMPDEETKEPYLIPVDITGATVSSGIRLKDVYSKLSEHPSERICVFIDACFSGGARNEGLIAGRNITVKPKEQVLKGKIMVFNASSGDQPSLPYKDKKHGMYTYYLLKFLKESKGQGDLHELTEFVKQQVGLESVIMNNKEQNPQVNTSTEVSKEWEKWKLTEKK